MKKMCSLPYHTRVHIIYYNQRQSYIVGTWLDIKNLSTSGSVPRLDKNLLKKYNWQFSPFRCLCNLELWSRLLKLVWKCQTQQKLSLFTELERFCFHSLWEKAKVSIHKVFFHSHLDGFTERRTLIMTLQRLAWSFKGVKSSQEYSTMSQIHTETLPEMQSDCVFCNVVKHPATVQSATRCLIIIE